MAIIDEPVRGSVPPSWWWSLPGLERIQALARGHIPQAAAVPGAWRLYALA